MTRAPVAALLGALAAASLAGCEDWDQLACGLRHVCGDDVGAFQLQAGLDDPAPAALLAFAVGERSRVLLTSRTVLVQDDAGSRAIPAQPSSAWLALDGVGAPTRFFLADRAGTVASWIEPARADQRDVSVSPDFPFTPGVAVAYLDVQLRPAAAFFGVATGSLQVGGVSSDGGLPGTDSQACDLQDLQGAAIVGRGTSLVAGIAPTCTAAGTSTPRYVATFWPRASANPAPVALSTEAAPSRLRVGSNGDVATVAYEVGGGIAVARVVDAGVQNNLLSVVYSSDGGASVFRGLLDGVLQLGDPDRFAYALTNHNAGSLGVTPDQAGAASVDVPAGATLLVFGRWPDRNSSQVTGTQVLLPSRPFTALRFGLDPHQAEAWLVAACPPTADAGSFDTYCPGPGAHFALFRWVP